MTDRSPKGNHMERKEVTRMLVGVQPQGQGTIRVVGAKLHGIVVTESKLNYHGSITIDTDILEAAHLLPLEYVYIWNKHSGSRIETYVLPGPRGSGVVCLNGAAARTCQVGDEIIVASSREIPVSDYHDGFSCRVLTFDQRRAAQPCGREAGIPRGRQGRRHGIRHHGHGHRPGMDRLDSSFTRGEGDAIALPMPGATAS